MNVNLFDPSLYDQGGHQLDWALRLSRELAARGHAVHVYTHAQADAATLALLRAQVPAQALFRVVPYVVRSLLTTPATAGLHLLDAGARSLALFNDGARLLAEDLGQAAPADLHIWTTFNAYQLHAVAQSPARVRTVGCLHEHPTFYDPAGNLCWRYAWLKARDAGVPLRLGVTVPELQPGYNALFDNAPLPVLPNFADGRPSQVRHLHPKRIGFFGKQRNEKGVEIIEWLARNLLDRGHEVVLQDSGGCFVGRKIERLTLLAYVQDLAAEISRCDLVVAPYEPVAYAMRASGVVAEALASGVPVVVPARTAAANLVMPLGAGKCFESYTPPGVLDAIIEACNDYRRLAKHAWAASQAWPRTHGVKRFTDALLEGA